VDKWKRMQLFRLLSQRKEKIIIDPDKEYSLVTISNKGIISLRETKKGALISATEGFVARSGDFIYSRLSVHTGAFGLVPSELDGALITNEMPYFQIDKKLIIPDFLLDALSQPDFLWQLKQLTKGVGRVRIKEASFLALQIHIPGLEEQKKIESHINSLKNTCKAMNIEFTHQKNLLKKFRQQILQEAIEGKLTADWRAQNPDVEPASEMLKRIAAEKAQLVKDKKIKAQKPLPPITDEEKPFELPEGWEWCRLGNVAYGFQYGTSSKSAKTGDIPVLRMGNIQAGEIDWDNLVYSNDAAENDKYRLTEGDLLFNRTNSRELVGKTALYRGDQTAIYAGYLVRFHMADGISPDFANIVMNSRLHSEWCDEVKTDALGQSNINATKLSNFRFPLASMDEQEKIVDKAYKLLALYDQLETQITQNQTHAEQLMQAVLKEAFSHNSEVEPTAKKDTASTHISEGTSA